MNKIFNAVTTCLAAVLLIVLALLSVRGIVDPQTAANAFGFPAADPSAAFYHAVYRDRNLVLALTGLVFLGLRMWQPLAILSTASITLPAYDIVVLKLHSVAVAAVHPTTLASLVILSALLWIRVLRTHRQLASSGRRLESR